MGITSVIMESAFLVARGVTDIRAAVMGAMKEQEIAVSHPSVVQ